MRVETKGSAPILGKEELHFEALRLAEMTLGSLRHVPEFAHAVASSFLSTNPRDVRKFRDLHQITFEKGDERFDLKFQIYPFILPLGYSGDNNNGNPITGYTLSLGKTDEKGEESGFALSVDNHKPQWNGSKVHFSRGANASRQQSHDSLETVELVENFLSENFPASA